MPKCAICGEDYLSRKLYQEMVEAIRKMGGLTGEMCNPGGRELTFQNGKRIQLSDYCTNCDFRDIIELSRRED